MNNSKQIEIFKEVEEQNARLTDEMRKCEEYADRLNKENKELKTYIQKMDKPEIKTIDSEIALKNIELQEENKKLKESADEAKIEHENLLINRNNFAKRVKKLEQENKELKNRLKILDDEDFVYEVTEIEYSNFKKMNEYKQALEEIRDEIGDLKDINKLINLQKILDKINEVLNEK